MFHIFNSMLNLESFQAISSCAFLRKLTLFSCFYSSRVGKYVLSLALFPDLFSVSSTRKKLIVT